MIKFGSSLSYKFLLVWGGSVVVSLALVGVVFAYLLGQYHQVAAGEALTKSFKQMDAQLLIHDQRIDSIVLGLAQDRDVISIINLLNKYQDKANYQPLVFDTEKKKLASRLLDREESAGHAYFAIYTRELEMAAYSLRVHPDRKSSGIVSYRDGAPIVLARHDDANFIPVAGAPAIAGETIPIRLPDGLEHAYRLVSGKFFHTNAAPIVYKRVNKPDEVIGVVVSATIIDEHFTEQMSHLIGRALSIQFPDAERMMPLGQLPKVSAESLPDLFESPGVFQPIADKDYHLGGAKISTFLGKDVTFLVGVDKKVFVTEIFALQQSILGVLVVIAIVMLPLGVYFVRRNLTRPIRQLMSGVDALSRHGPDINISYHSRDELGSLAESFNAMAQTIRIREEDLRKNSDQISHEMNRAKKFLDIAEAIIVELDVHGTVVLINRQGCDLLGYSEKEIVGKNWFYIAIPEEIREEIKAIHDNAFSEESDHNEYFENEVLTKKGERRAIAWHNVVETDDDGNIVGTLSSGQDISKRKEAEAALRQSQKMEAVGQLTGGIAHDFNNLLHVIAGNLGMLDEDLRHDVSAQKMISAATVAAFRGGELTKQLLAFSRQQALHPEVVAVNEVAIETLKLIERTLGEDVMIRTAFDDGLGSVYIDRGMLGNAILNLAINARDAMPKGGELLIETATVDLDGVSFGEDGDTVSGPYILITMSDTGIGMDAETLTHVFEPFFTTKEVGKGSGMGLSMVYGFVTQSGGYVRIDSEEGKGTAVKLYFAAVAAPFGEAKEADGKTKSVAKGDETILVVEDDEDVRDVTVAMLSRLGYEVLEAEDGPSALALLGNGGKRVDLVLSDVVMPSGMSGLELAHELRRHYQDIKILMVSGYLEGSIGSEELDEIKATLLRKPFEFGELAAAVRGALEQ